MARRSASPADIPRAGGFVAQLARERFEIVEVPLDDARLATNPINPPARGFDEDIDDLAASIRQNGLLQPLAVIPIDRYRADNPTVELPATTEWVLHDGHRRRMAGRKAGLSTLPGFVRNRPSALVDLITGAIAANRDRKGFDPSEEAGMLRSLQQETGWSQRQLADATRISQPQVSRFLTLADLPVEVQKAVDAGQVAMQDVPDLSRLDETRQREAVRRAVSSGEPVAVQVRRMERGLPESPAQNPFTPSQGEAPTAPVLHLPARGPAADPSESRRPPRPRVAPPQETADDTARVDAAQARAAACRQLVGASLKTTDILMLLQDAALLPVHDTSPQAIHTAAEWCGTEVVGDPTEWVAGRHARRFRQKLAIAVYLAHREADIAVLGGKSWGAAARLHVARLIALGVHELSDYERGQGVTVSQEETE